MKKSFACIFLAALMLLSSCGNATNGTETQGSSGSSESGSDVSSTEAEDRLGEHDFGGAEFRIYTRVTQLFYPYLDVQEETADVLNDAVYKRNRKLEERFNFTFKEDYYDSSEARTGPDKLLRSGDDLYELYEGRNVFMFDWAAEGFFHLIKDLPDINLSESWWNPELTNALSLCGKQYFAAGTFNISSYDYTHVLLFNKDMADKNQLDDLYELVRSGKWTYDSFAKNARAVVSDLNGDSVMDEDDQYGYTSLAKQVMPALWISAGCTSVKKDNDGKLVFSAPTDQKFIDVYQRIFTITWDDNIWHRVPVSVDGEEEKELFSTGHSLFTNASCYQISTMRDSSVDFGVLPYPKYDETQEKYYSRIEGCELFGVPLTNSNMEMTSVVLEAMAYESLKSVIPAYYDITLKVKLTRDDESADMLDIVFANRVFDYGDTLLCGEFRDGVVRQAFAKDNRNVVSLLTSAEKQVNAKIDQLNSAFSD